MHVRVLVGVLLLVGPACAKEVVVHQQTEADANRILYLLAKEGVIATKMKDEKSRDLRFDIQVPKDEETKTYAILDKHRLPEVRRDGTSELFKEGGLIPTSEQQRAKREIGIAGDIVNSLRKVSRVVDASALVSIPEDNPLRDVNEAKPKPKAAVMVSYLPDEKGNPPVSVEDVQRFVQAALPELRSSEVSVQLIAGSEKTGKGATTGENGEPVAADLGADACSKVTVMGIDVCSDHKKRLINSLLGGVVVAGGLSALAVVSMLRAMRYRKDLTRLTAQVAQLKPR